jgi:hypothetical protein
MLGRCEVLLDLHTTLCIDLGCCLSPAKAETGLCTSNKIYTAWAIGIFAAKRHAAIIAVH